MLPFTGSRPCPSLETLLAGAPTPAAQAVVLGILGGRLEPLRLQLRLPAYELAPGTRLRRLWGRCQHFPDGRTPLIQVRCTGDDRRTWRDPSAMTGTLLHELAHLKYKGHGPRFWTFLRRLLDQAAATGLYRPTAEALGEGSRGDTKLAGTAADGAAQAALERRRERAAANRAAAAAFKAGDEVYVDVSSGALAGARVRVAAKARGWLTVDAPNGRRYRVAASVLRPVLPGA